MPAASSRWWRLMLHLHSITVWDNRAAVAWPSLGPACKYLSFPASWSAPLPLLWKTSLLLPPPLRWGEGFVAWWAVNQDGVHPYTMLLYNCGKWFGMDTLGQIWGAFGLLHIIDWFGCLFAHFHTQRVTLELININSHMKKLTKKLQIWIFFSVWSFTK